MSYFKSNSVGRQYPGSSRYRRMLEWCHLANLSWFYPPLKLLHMSLFLIFEISPLWQLPERSGGNCRKDFQLPEEFWCTSVGKYPSATWHTGSVAKMTICVHPHDFQRWELRPTYAYIDSGRRALQPELCSCGAVRLWGDKAAAAKYHIFTCTFQIRPSRKRVKK